MINSCEESFGWILKMKTEELSESYTSNGAKLFFHQEAMQDLRNGKGTPISCWIAPTDVCNAKCAFCSVGERPGDVLPMRIIHGFLDQLIPLGLKSVTLSGGGNVLLYRCPETKTDFKGLAKSIHDKGLEMGMITNGMPMVEYEGGRKSWKTCKPETLDYFTWIRISMAGLDHPEKVVYVPDIDASKTTLGFSWIMSDSYEEPSHKHGWVSTPEDIKTPMENRTVKLVEDRLPWVEEQIRFYTEKHKPEYVRLLSNCLQPDLIPHRHAVLTDMANRINPSVIFSQFKPPQQPRRKCAKVYTRPCLNACGTVFCCDSIVLNKTAGHKFGNQWGVCKWDEVGELFANPIRQVIPDDICPGCVFFEQVDLIGDVIAGAETPIPSGNPPAHLSFI